MPRYYCDYCDTYLTHDSPSVRKQHNAGYKHKANVRSYYQQFEEQQTQSLIDQKVKEHLGQAGYQQVGAAFHQHLMQAGQYRPPIPLPLPVHGGVRPLPIPRPGVAPPGYAGPPGVRPPTLTPPGAPATSYPPPATTTSMSSVPGAPSNVNSYPNISQVSGAPTASYPPQAQAASNGTTQYSSQQSFRPMAPPASSVPSNYPSSTTAATPAANYST